MYCHKCGYRINPKNAKYCLHCGEEADRAEICGGFYGIAGKTIVPEENVQPQKEDPGRIKRKYEALLDIKEKEVKRSRKKSMVLLCVALALAVLFFVFGIVQSFRIGGVKKELKLYKEREEVSFENFREVLSLQDQIGKKNGSLLIATKESEALEEALKELQQEVSEEDEEPVGESEEENFNLLLYVWSLAHEVHDYFLPPEQQDDPMNPGDQETGAAVNRINQEAIARLTKQLEDRKGTIQVLQSDIERLEKQKASLLEEMGLLEESGEE